MEYLNATTSFAYTFNKAGTADSFVVYPAATFVGSLAGTLTGNASTATALQTARAINGVNFDGSAAITITAAAGTLTGATLNATVLASSLTSVGILATLQVTSSTTSGTVNPSSLVWGFASTVTSPTGAQNRLAGLFVSNTTFAGVFTTNVANGVYIANTGIGAGSTITAQRGLEIADMTSGGTNHAIYTGAGLVRFGDAVGINGKTPVVNVAAPTAAGDTYTATEQTLLNDIRTRLINFGIYT